MNELISKPVALDFFCCQGGASVGLSRAGFRVIGSDLESQPYYPFTFHQGDFREQFWELIATYDPMIITGSPPCQGRTNAQKIQKRQHPRLIAPFRKLCQEWGGVYMIENVEPQKGVPDEDPLVNPVMLCGYQFGLHTDRHRLFESNVPLAVPGHSEHPARKIKMGRRVVTGDHYFAVGNFSDPDRWIRKDMDVEWMTRDGVRECIPPVYTEYLGRQLLPYV